MHSCTRKTESDDQDLRHHAKQQQGFDSAYSGKHKCTADEGSGMTGYRADVMQQVHQMMMIHGRCVCYGAKGTGQWRKYAIVLVSNVPYIC